MICITLKLVLSKNISNTKHKSKQVNSALVLPWF